MQLWMLYVLFLNLREVCKNQAKQKLAWVYDNILIPGTRFLTDTQDNGVPFDRIRFKSLKC